MSVASLSLPAFGTTATLCVTLPGALSAAGALLEQELTETDAACSRFRPDSELARLNAAGGRPIAVGARLLEAIQVALAAAASSCGLVDPTIGRTLRLAGYDRTFPLVGRRDGHSFSASFASVPGWRRVEVDAERQTVRVPAGCELDLGATAKALAADRVARTAAAAVGGGVLISLGGDIAVEGEPPTGGWPIGLADDHAASVADAGPVISLASGGLATSGTSVRRWHANGVQLHHVVDPRSGRPAKTPWRTVSVAARSCLEANVASTASIVLGEAAAEWLARSGLPARLVRTSGAVVCVAGWPEEAR